MAVAILFMVAQAAETYEQWSINDDPTYCGECHGDFRAPAYVSRADGDPWGDSLHDVHRNVMLNGDCDTCHLGGNEFPVLLNLSNGGNGLEPVSCVGCHGIDPDPGTPNTEWGAGLRLHHINAGVPPDMNDDTCVDCHLIDPTPMAESVAPAYYFTPDPSHPGKPTDPCNPSPDFVEHFSQGTMGSYGLDNDGDLAYDVADADCGGASIFTDGFESGDISAWSDSVP